MSQNTLAPTGAQRRPAIKGITHCLNEKGRLACGDVPNRDTVAVKLSEWTGLYRQAGLRRCSRCYTYHLEWDQRVNGPAREAKERADRRRFPGVWKEHVRFRAEKLEWMIRALCPPGDELRKLLAELDGMILDITFDYPGKTGPLT